MSNENEIPSCPSNINENEDLMPHTSRGWEDQMSFVLRKLNQVQQDLLQIFGRILKGSHWGIKGLSSQSCTDSQRHTGPAFGFSLKLTEHDFSQEESRTGMNGQDRK